MPRSANVAFIKVLLLIILGHELLPASCVRPFLFHSQRYRLDFTETYCGCSKVLLITLMAPTLNVHIKFVNFTDSESIFEL